MRLLVATRNRGKLAELTALFADIPELRLLCLADLAPLPEVVEDGETFLANAQKKAREMAIASGLPTLADDSGLMVDALDGAPGVYSARFTGEHATDAENNAELLRRLAGVPLESRAARFRCVLALATPDGAVGPHTRGECEGRIVFEPRGDAGFGYDPLFEVVSLGRTMAQLTSAEKHALSHRGAAARAMCEPLVDWLARDGASYGVG
ncbi:MAG: XTP/dITP diphosphatase [Deltaproteobacteria bacterium]|nr:XTP/dITP diphosphatase [Deltaproteobacteria bacterium]